MDEIKAEWYIYIYIYVCVCVYISGREKGGSEKLEEWVTSSDCSSSRKSAGEKGENE